MTAHALAALVTTVPLFHTCGKSVMALGLVGPVGQEEVVDGVLGVGLDRSVELVVIPDQG